MQTLPHKQNYMIFWENWEIDVGFSLIPFNIPPKSQPSSSHCNSIHIHYPHSLVICIIWNIGKLKITLPKGSISYRIIIEFSSSRNTFTEYTRIILNWFPPMLHIIFHTTRGQKKIWNAEKSSKYPHMATNVIDIHQHLSVIHNQEYLCTFVAFRIVRRKNLLFSYLYKKLYTRIIYLHNMWCYILGHKCAWHFHKIASIFRQNVIPMYKKMLRHFYSSTLNPEYCF